MIAQILPLGVLFATQNLVPLLGDAIPEKLASWLPMLAAALAFILTSKYQQAQTAKATAGLIGQEAPDFEIEFKDKKTMLKKLILDSSLPTLVDFYSNG